MWGHAPTTPEHIFAVFAAYIEGDVPRLPWCENAIQLETLPLKETLKRINSAGFLTINSQPRVNGASSTDPAVGWGGCGRVRVPEGVPRVLLLPPSARPADLPGQAQWPSLTYTAVNVKGDVITNLNVEDKTVNAVTWGVFPNKEIIQPTIVDVDSFMAWKDEAFALWTSQWARHLRAGQRQLAPHRRHPAHALPGQRRRQRLRQGRHVPVLQPAAAVTNRGLSGRGLERVLSGGKADAECLSGLFITAAGLYNRSTTRLPPLSSLA